MAHVPLCSATPADGALRGADGPEWALLGSLGLLMGSFKGDIDIGIGIDIDSDI